MPMKEAQRRTVVQSVSQLLMGESIDLAPFRVVEDYFRWKQLDRNKCQDFVQEIGGALTPKPTGRYQNFLVGGKSGSGKTQLNIEIAKQRGIELTVLNCARNQDESAFRRTLSDATRRQRPAYVLIDEVDAGVTSSWVCGALLGPLEMNRRGLAPVVFALVGSSSDLTSTIKHFPKGEDFLNRISRSFSIPDPTPEDRGLVFLARLKAEAATRRKEVLAVEKKALQHVMTDPELGSLRRIGDLAIEAVERNGSDTRVKFVDLFGRNNEPDPLLNLKLAPFGGSYLFVSDSSQRYQRRTRNGR
jgi:hypothetical protein